MTSNVDSMIDSLTPVIEQKCKDLQLSRKERLQSRLFALLCISAAIIPALLVFMGVSLTLLIAPLIFMSFSIILLLPILLSGKTSNQGGTVYEQV